MDKLKRCLKRRHLFSLEAHEKMLYLKERMISKSFFTRGENETK